jgi:hypothetical protein
MKDFVTFEIAKKLKEEGFNKECLAYYTEDTEFYYNTCCGSDVESAFRSFNSQPNSICGKRIDAPIISQVLDWLRKEKELHVEIYMYHNCYLWEIYNTEIYDIDFTQKCEKYSEIEYDSYEQAAMVGIEYVLDNLI